MIPNRRGITTETKANNYLRIHSIHAIQFHDFLGALNINELLSFYTAIKLQVCSHPVIKRWDWGPGVSVPPIVKRGVILTPPRALNWTGPILLSTLSLLPLPYWICFRSLGCSIDYGSISNTEKLEQLRATKMITGLSTFFFLLKHVGPNLHYGAR